jgi:hypothetical protein
MLPARALSSFGDDMTLIVLTLRLYDQGFGPWSITTLLFCAAFPVVVLAHLAGRLVDSVPFRRLSALTALSQAACCIRRPAVDDVRARAPAPGRPCCGRADVAGDDSEHRPV